MIKNVYKNINNFFCSKKNLILFFAFLILTIYYFSFAMSILWDTGHYMTYIDILEGNSPWSSWDIVRGLTFPLIIYLSNLLFGKTTQGIIILSFIFYLVMLFFTKKILDRVYEKGNNKKICAVILTYIILDPIIFGYYHTLLTEFVAMTISVAMCYYSWKWLDIDFFENKKRFILYGLMFILMSIISWHLKQPYVSIALFPVLIATLISIIQKKTLKNIIQRLLIATLCIIGVAASIIGWNKFLSSKNIDLNTDRNVISSFGEQLVNALNNYEIKKDSNESDYVFLNDSEKEKVDSGWFYLVNVYDLKNKLVDQKIIALNYSKKIKTTTAIKFILKEFVDHPLLVTESYTSTYLAIADVYPKKTDDSVSYYVEKKFDFKYCHENCTIALRVKEEKSNVAYMLEDATLRVANYEQYNASPIMFRNILKILSPISQIIFKIIILGLPLFAFMSLISFFRKSNYKSKRILNIVVILLWYSFLHILVHTASGANIDRYASPAIITSFIGIVLYINLLVEKIINRKKSIK